MTRRSVTLPGLLLLLVALLAACSGNVDIDAIRSADRPEVCVAQIAVDELDDALDTISQQDPATLAAIGAKYGLTFLPAAASNENVRSRSRAMASTDGLSSAELDAEVTSG